MFKEISEAYENIGDENKRNLYNQQRNNPFANFGASNEFDLNNIFEQMMGGGRQHKPKAPDKVLSIDISVLDSYHGAKKEFTILNNLICNPCNGTGGNKKICETCMGNGFIIQTFGTNLFKQQFQTTCPTCKGSGDVILTPCKVCNGTALNQVREKFLITIPQSSDNGDFMRLREKGDYSPNLKLRGDLIIKVNLNNDNTFEKIGKDLVYKLRLDPIDLIIGDKITVEHPDGDLNVNFPDYVSTEKPLRIPNRGFKTQEGNGHFYIKLIIERTKIINNESKEKIKSILKVID